MRDDGIVLKSMTTEKSNTNSIQKQTITKHDNVDPGAHFDENDYEAALYNGEDHLMKMMLKVILRLCLLCLSSGRWFYIPVTIS